MKRALCILLLVCAAHTTAAEAFQTYATVVNVQPVVETIYEPVTRRVCTDPDSAARQFASLSATIGEDIRQQNRLWQSQRACKTIVEKQPRETVTAYRVTYSYRGYTSTTRLSYHPGERVPVNVSLSPLP